MNIIEVPYESLDPMYQRYVDEGYEYGCECGESWNSVVGAESCRKCRVYLLEGPTSIYHTTAKA